MPRRLSNYKERIKEKEEELWLLKKDTARISISQDRRACHTLSVTVCVSGRPVGRYRSLVKSHSRCIHITHSVSFHMNQRPLYVYIHTLGALLVYSLERQRRRWEASKEGAEEAFDAGRSVNISACKHKRWRARGSLYRMCWKYKRNWGKKQHCCCSLLLVFVFYDTRPKNTVHNIHPILK